MGSLFGHQHGAALSHAQHRMRRQQGVRRGLDILRADEALRLPDGVNVRAGQLGAQVRHRIFRLDLSGEGIAVFPGGSGGGDSQPEGAVTPVAHSTAETGDRGFRNAAGGGQLGNRHGLGALAIGHHKGGQLLFRSGQLVILLGDAAKDVFFRHSGTPPFSVWDRGAQRSNSWPSMVSHMIRQRGRWKGPLKVEPLVEGIVGRPSRRRYPYHSPNSGSEKCSLQ